MRSLVWFAAGGRPYAVDALNVLQVRESSAITPLPGHGDEVVGMVTIDEQAVPVSAALGPVGRHVLVMTAGDELFGLAVDDVAAVRAVDDSAIAPPPPGPEDALVAGVVRGGEELVLLLDAAAIVRRLRAAEEAAS